jgi:hypothetical protein
MRGACTGARSKPSSTADQLALTCSAGRDAAANLARFGAHDPGANPGSPASVEASMQRLRICSTADGESHFGQAAAAVKILLTLP